MEFEKAAYRPISRAKSPPADSVSRVKSPLSRSISPAPRPKSILRLPATLHHDYEGSYTDRGVAPSWDIPTTRAELLERYYVRNCETQPSPPRTRFLSYRLDAAALLVGRLTKHLGKVLEKWKRKAGEVKGKRKRRAMGSSLSMQLFPILGTESTDSDTLDGQRSQISLQSRRAWQQQRASERVYSALSTLISRRLRLLWTISAPLLVKESAALQLFAVLVGCLDKRLQAFFTHELFEIPTEQYQTFRQMIKGVNRMVTILCKVVIRDAFGQLRAGNQREHIEIGLWNLGQFLRKRVKEDFNRLRFFAEVLEEVRKKTKRRQALQRPFLQLFSLLSATYLACYRRGFRGIQEAARLRVFSLAVRRPSVRVIVKGIRKSVGFRLKTAYRIWANRQPVSACSAPLIQQIGLFARLRLDYAWKAIKMRSILGRNSNIRGFLMIQLCEIGNSRLLFAWAKLQSCPRPCLFPCLCLRRILTTCLKRRAFRALLGPKFSLSAR